jgi:hypothetical protein
MTNLMQTPLLKAVARRRRLVAKTSRWPVLPLLQLVGAMAHVVTSGRDSPPIAMRVVHGAWYATPSAIELRSAGRSRSLWSSSASNKSCSRIVMAHLLGNGRASSRLSRRMTRMRRWRSRMPEELPRPSTVALTSTPAPTSAGSSSTSCMPLLGQHVQTCHQASVLGSGSNRTCTKGGTPKQVDGDTNRL